jgi:hypothetical protein
MILNKFFFIDGFPRKRFLSGSLAVGEMPGFPFFFLHYLASGIEQNLRRGKDPFDRG